MSIFERNPESSYPPELIDWINSMKIDNDSVMHIAGSVSWRDFEQYADIDLYQDLNVNVLTPAKFHTLLMMLVGKMEQKGAILSELKVGMIDHINALNKYMGICQSGIISGYDHQGLFRALMRLYNAGWISKDIYDEINTAMDGHTSLLGWEALKETIRLAGTLRWNRDEIMMGYKMHHGRKLHIDQYSLTNPPAKIDFLINLDGWVEITSIIRINVNGIPLNHIPLTPPMLYQSVAENCEKLLYSPFFRNEYKGLKRMWILARLRDDSHIGGVLADMLNSDVGNMYIATSLLGNMATIWEIDNKRPLDYGMIVWHLSKCTSIQFDLERTIKDIKTSKSSDALKYIKHYLEVYLNEYAVQWIHTNRFEAEISRYLSVTYIYNHNLLI